MPRCLVGRALERELTSPGTRLPGLALWLPTVPFRTRSLLVSCRTEYRKRQNPGVVTSTGVRRAGRPRCRPVRLPSFASAWRLRRADLWLRTENIVHQSAPRNRCSEKPRHIPRRPVVKRASLRGPRAGDGKDKTRNRGQERQPAFSQRCGTTRWPVAGLRARREGRASRESGRGRFQPF